MFFLVPTGLILCTFLTVKMSKDQDKPGPQTLPCIDSVTPVASTKWLSLQTIDYTDQEGNSRKWDVATRTTKASTDHADAVMIIPLLKKKSISGEKESSANEVVETLLVEQYRPPVGRATIEFPAGLIDKDESPEDAALRELREETGFVGEKCKAVPQVSREVCMSPGLTDESVKIVVVEVDLNNPNNFGTPKQQLEDGEHVTVKRVELKAGLKAVLDDSEGMPIMGLMLFAMGLEIGTSL